MRATGMVRALDDLNRLCVPKEIVDKMELTHAKMEIFVDGGNIILRKYEPGCSFCGRIDDIRPFLGKKICASCRVKIRQNQEGC